MTSLRLGTRRSALATTQSGHVADALRAAGHDVELVEIVTEGDTNRASLASMGGTGVFALSLIHISEPTRRHHVSRMPSSA